LLAGQQALAPGLVLEREPRQERAPGQVRELPQEVAVLLRQEVVVPLQREQRPQGRSPSFDD
jgi:hypothetical protein